jgi:hypothetical protein
MALDKQASRQTSKQATHRSTTQITLRPAAQGKRQHRTLIATPSSGTMRLCEQRRSRLTSCQTPPESIPGFSSNTCGSQLVAAAVIIQQAQSSANAQAAGQGCVAPAVAALLSTAAVNKCY